MNASPVNAGPEDGTVGFYADYIRARGLDDHDRIDWTALAWIDVIARRSSWLTDTAIVARIRNVLAAAEQIHDELRNAR